VRINKSPVSCCWPENELWCSTVPAHGGSGSSDRRSPRGRGS
jgi:hypothetical protein